MSVLTYAEELERKTLDTVERLALRHEQGVLDNRTLAIAMQAVWDATGGLVDQMTAITGELADLKLDLEPVQIVVSNGTDVFIVGRNKLSVSVLNAKTFAESNFKVFDTEADAAEHAAKLVRAFMTKGFRKL